MGIEDVKDGYSNMKEIKKNKEKVMVDTRGKSGYRRSKIGYRSKGGYR